MTKLLGPALTIMFLSISLFAEENNSAKSVDDTDSSFFKFLGMSKKKNSYAPTFKNDQNLSAYRWNALETKWVNAS